MKPGDTIGRYRLEQLLGKGGMGHVFRAWDETLRRRVAIKLLRPHGPREDMATIQKTSAILREARLAAGLDHPNIVAIHDVCEHEGAPYIVMEHVSGAPLRSYIGRADVPQAVRIGWLTDVARALSAAHRRGLVHRDVKPENVMVRDDGVVKVVDFGIAFHETRSPASTRAPIQPAGDDAPDSDNPTIEKGYLAGTPAYMAPELLGEEPIDARADQFSWAVMAYEVITGALPWKGAGRDAAALLGAIVLVDPDPLDPEALQIPPVFAAAVQRALTKPKGGRFRSMDALLADIARAPSDAALPPPPAPPASAPVLAQTGAEPRRLRTATLGAAAALIAVLATLGFALSRSAPAPVASAAGEPPAGIHFSPRNARRLTFNAGCDEHPSLAPDGRTLIFDASAGHDTHVYALDITTNTQRQITHERGWQWAAAVSPDGKRIAYMRQQDGTSATHILPIEGGASRFVAEGTIRPTFSPDGSAVWTGTRAAALRVDPDTHAVTRTLRPPPGYEMVTVKELPDGRAVVRFWDHDLKILKGVGVYAKGASESPTLLTEDVIADMAALSPDGRWIFIQRAKRDSEADITAFPLAGGPPLALPTKEIRATAGMVFSAGGERVIWSTCQARGLLGTLDAGKGATAKPLGTPADWLDRHPAWVPGSTRFVVVSSRGGGDRLWLLDRSDREPPKRIPTGERTVDAPVVSPDGRWVVFVEVGHGLSVAPIDGSTPPRRLTSGSADTAPSLSRDGATVFFQTPGDRGRPRIDAVPFAGGAPRVVRAEAARPAASPAADKLAFIAVDGDGEEGVPTLRDLRTNQEKPLSPALTRGRHPGLRFSNDGKRAAVLDGATAVVEVDVAKGAVVRRYDSGNNDVMGLTYTGDEILIAHRTWSGNLWIADDPLR